MEINNFVFYFDLGVLFVLFFFSVFKLINSKEKKMYSFFTIAVICQIIKYLTSILTFHESFISSLTRALVAIFLILYNIEIIKIKSKVTLSMLYGIIAIIIVYFFLEQYNQTPPIDFIYKRVYFLGSGIEIIMFSIFLYTSIRLKSYFLYKISYATLLFVCLSYTFLMFKVVFFKFPQNEVFSPLLISLFNSSYIMEMLLFFVARFFFEEKMIQKSIALQNQILKNEINHQKLLNEQRERISSDMHDDIGARISTLKLHGEFIKEKYTENPHLKAELDELMKTTEEMTVSMREMIWNLKTQNDFLQNFINYSQQYANGFFAKSKAQIHFKNEIEENQHFNAEIRRNLFLCYKEALNNIYKHSQATEVYIIFSTKNSRLKLEISDNGIGFQPNENNQGNGMYNMKTRMTEISGDFETPKVEKGMLLKFSTPLELV